jgi:predicted nucleic acid-binding protein
MAKIFIDTGAFIALASTMDKYHARANSIYDDLVAQSALLITTNHIVDEACTWFTQRLRNGYAHAKTLGETVAAASTVIGIDGFSANLPVNSRLIVVYSVPLIENHAWNIFNKYDTVGFSFTDCVSFAVMELLGIQKAFTFDTHYDVMGFERL